MANPDLALKAKIRAILAAAGASEALTYSFVHGSLLESAGQDRSKAFHLRNAISPELQYYRPSLAPSLLEKVHANIKSGFDELALFELGTTRVKGLSEQKTPAEFQRLAIVVARKQPSSKLGAAYYAARRYSDYLLGKLGQSSRVYEPLSHSPGLPPQWKPALGAFEISRSALVKAGPKVLGIVGEPSAGLRQSLKLPIYTSMLELDIAVLADSTIDDVYTQLNKFPELSFDLCLRSSPDVDYSKLENLLNGELDKAAKEHGYGFSLSPIDIYAPEHGPKHRQTTWRITLWHPARTLTTAEANNLADHLAKTAKSKLKAVRV